MEEAWHGVAVGIGKLLISIVDGSLYKILLSCLTCLLYTCTKWSSSWKILKLKPAIVEVE